MSQKIEYIIKPPSKFSLNLQELWLYRELFYFFTWRDVKVKYKQTVLGFLWAVLQPFLMMMVFVVFFSRALKIPTDNIPAPVFYFSGLLLWNLFSTGLGTASQSMVSNSNIIKKVYFPRLIIPVSSILVSVFDFLMAFIVFLCIIAFYQITMPEFVIQSSIFIFLPLGLLLTVMSTLGLGFIFSSLNVQYRDFRYIIPFMLQMMLFTTPVIYPITVFDNYPLLKYVLALNPMTGAITLVRNSFVPEAINWLLVGISAGMSVVLLLFGIYIFRKMEAYFADIA